MVMNLCQVFDQEPKPLQIETAQKEAIQCCKMNLSCVNILLFSAYKWNITRFSLVTDVHSFSHLILLLRSLHVNNEKAKVILHPDKNTITSSKVKC